MADVKWIKIVTDIFDDEKVLLIESLPSADSIIVIWFKLLCLAGKNNNSGVFLLNDKIAYTDEMLATIFRREVNTIRLALRTFQQYGMIEIVDNVITIPNWSKHQTLDQIEERKDYMKEYMRNRRAKQKELIDCKVNCKSNSKANVNSLEVDKIREEVDKTREEVEGDKKKKNTKVAKAPVDYYPNDDLLNQSFIDYVAMRKQLKKPMTDKAIQLAMKNLETLSGGDNDKAIKIIEQSIMNSWQGLFELKESKKPRKSTNKFNDFPQREYTKDEMSALEQKLNNLDYFMK